MAIEKGNTFFKANTLNYIKNKSYVVVDPTAPIP